LYTKICIIALIPVSIGILVQMFYASINVAGRYLFNQPAAGAMEASGEAMIYIVYLGLAYIQLTDSHIRIDFIFSHISSRTKNVIDIIACLLGILFFGFIIWFSFLSALHSLKIREVVWGSVAFPVYPQRFAISLGSLMMVIQLTLDLIQAILHLKKPIEPEPPKIKVEVI
jgi:TRAP-type mannitol/chloroaromatic compound transport system permease small subunit